MSQNFIHSRCPVVARETVAIIRRVSLDGVGAPYVGLKFEREVLTLRETTTTARTVAGDAVIARDGETHNDFYGLFTSATEHPEKARTYADLYGMKVGDPVRREVVTTLTDRRVLPGKAGDSFNRETYLIPPGDWMLDGPAAERWMAERKKPFEEQSFDIEFPAVAQVREVEFVIWRSDLSDAENTKAEEVARAAIFEGVA